MQFRTIWTDKPGWLCGLLYFYFEIIQKMKDTKVIIITAYDSFEYAQKVTLQEFSKNIQELQLFLMCIRYV